MTKLNKSQFVKKARYDITRFNSAMSEQQKEVMLRDYDSHICRNGWKQNYKLGERRRNKV